MPIDIGKSATLIISLETIMKSVMEKTKNDFKNTTITCIQLKKQPGLPYTVSSGINGSVADPGLFGLPDPDPSAEHRPKSSENHTKITNRRLFVVVEKV